MSNIFIEFYLFSTALKSFKQNKLSILGSIKYKRSIFSLFGLLKNVNTPVAAKTCQSVINQCSPYT